MLCFTFIFNLFTRLQVDGVADCVPELYIRTCRKKFQG